MTFFHFLHDAIQLAFGFRSGDGNSPAYLFWSGAGSDLAYLGFLWGGIVLYRKNNCAIHGCWRIGKHEFTEPGTGVKRLLCWRHHPDVAHKHLTRERLHLYIGQRPGKG